MPCTARHRDMNRDIGDDTNERSEAVNRTVEGKVLARGLAAGQTLYRLMGDRLGPLLVAWSTNPGSEGLTDHSPGGLMLQHPGHAQVIGTRQAIKGPALEGQHASRKTK